MFQLGQSLTIAVVGDSKSRGATCCTSDEAGIGYRTALRSNLAALALWSVIDISSAVYAVDAQTAATAAAGIGAFLAGQTVTADYALVNLGSNDLAGLPAEATWKADYATVLDALHTKWPAAQVLVMRPWRRGSDTNADTLAVWIADVISTRGWAALGPDERGYLKAGDDGVTNTSDGLHPNAAGYALTATEWQTAMGH